MVPRTFLLWGGLGEVKFMIAFNLKILGLYLLNTYNLMFLFSLFLNIGHITETFSRKLCLTNANARMRRSKEGVDIIRPSKLKAVTEKVYISFLVP